VSAPYRTKKAGKERERERMRRTGEDLVGDALKQGLHGGDGLDEHHLAKGRGKVEVDHAGTDLGDVDVDARARDVHPTECD
jgi:hypothetical protein